jgi:hypothetical protein
MVLALGAGTSSTPKIIEFRHTIWTCLGFGMLCFIVHRFMVQGHLSACEFSVVIITCYGTFDSISVDTHLYLNLY